MKLIYALIFVGVLGLADAAAPIAGVPLWRHAASVVGMTPADQTDPLLMSTADLPNANTIKGALSAFAREVHQTSRDLVPLVDDLADIRK